MTLFLCTHAQELAAQEISGSDVADFHLARSLWLEGEDLQALEKLGDMARAGNTSAQILLSQIASAKLTHQHVTEQLPRKERIQLLRHDKGLSGKDWMSVAAEQNELARAFQSLQSRPGQETDYSKTLATLIQHDEVKAALRGMLNASGTEYAKDAIDLLVLHSDLFGPAGKTMLAYLTYNELRSGNKAVFLPPEITSSDELLVYLQELNNLENIFAESGVISFEAKQNEEQYAMLVESADYLQPVVSFCKARCAGSQKSCMSSAAAALTWGGPFPYPLASPSRTFISDLEYWASPRFDRDLVSMLKHGKWQACSGFDGQLANLVVVWLYG